MKKLQLYLMITSVVIFSFGFILLPEGKLEFKTEWKKVEKLVEKGLPKSALKIVDSIYMVAKQNNNDPQVLKSLIYRVSLQSQFVENDLVNAIDAFEEELKNAAVPEKQILQSLLAELYSWYYQQNRWKINDMTTVVGIEEEDIRKWDAVKLNTKIRAYYLASLNGQEQLEDIDIEEFSAILNVEKNDKEAYVLWPTLYDLLGNRAINYFSSSDAELAKMGNDEVINGEYLVPVKDFIQLEIDENNDLTELKLYQQLLAFHLNENNTSALIDLDLKRLKYIYSHLSQDEKTRKVYIDLLNQLRENYKEQAVFVEISYELANLFYQGGRSYYEKGKNESRWDYNIADSICREAIADYPKALKANACRNLINDINEVKFGLKLNAAELPDKPFLGYLSYKNTTKLYYRIVKLDPDISKEKKRYDKDKNQVLKYLKKQAVNEWSVNLPDTKDHQSQTTEIRLPELSIGLYMVFSSDSPDFKKTDNLEYNEVWISNLSYLTKNDREEGSFELFVLDREEGSPVADVAVTTYRSVYEPRGREYSIKKLNTYLTDKSGYLKIYEQGDGKGSFIFSLEKDDDLLFSEGRNYIRHNRHDDKFRTKTYLFTDRAIYRPGQTVYLKGIVVSKNGNDVKIKPGYETRLELKNTNYKEVSSLEKTANEYGSFHGVFVIPQGGLNGRMTIKCESGTVSFLVEEYKRPTFQVLFDTIKDTYKLGDEIKVPGNVETYTGNAVSDANIKFRVVQQMMHMPYYRYYRPIPHFADKEIANGIVTSDEEGKFVISFQTESDQALGLRFDPNYLFKVHVDVTDMTGEVQSSETSIVVGRFSKLLSLKMENKIQKESTKGIKVSAKNLSGAYIELETNVEIFLLKPPDHLKLKRDYRWTPDTLIIPEEEYKIDFPFHVYKNENQKRLWKREKVYSGVMTISGEKVILGNVLKSSSPGQYFISIKDVSDTIIKAERYFTLYSTETKKIPENEILWSAITNKSAEPGDVIQLAVGSADKKTKILYELTNGDEVVERNWLTISRGQKIIDIPVMESYRGGFKITLRSIKHNRMFAESFNIKVPFTNKKLEIALETYRNFLTPGQKEEWKVKISGPNGSKIAAELLAGMYDASLDKFKSNKWGLNLYHDKNNTSRWGSGLFNTRHSSLLNNNKPEHLKVKHKVYPSINWFGYHQGYNRGIYNFNGNIRKQGFAQTSGEMEMTDADEVIVMDGEPPATNQDLSAIAATVGGDYSSDENVILKVEKELQIPLRTNFNETAFFYPQLQTDSSGSVILSFTTPDALTEWKLLMLAHTKDLKTGTFVEHIKAKKDLMVIPNVPRFIRQGDQLMFSAKVINYTDNQQIINVNLELFDPITMKLIDLIEPGNNNTLTIEVDANQSSLVQWKLNIPFNINMLGYRIKAASSTFSDGEERMIPVLTNRMLVTETLPMHMKGNETKEFRIDKLADSDKYMILSTRQNYRFTVEFTSNPAWYAIQALPYLSEPKVESASNLFNMYYANTLSSFILNSNPKIKNVLKSWKTHTPDAFLSNLQKNQELKRVVLNATPWVLEAESEEEQKRRIALLFDINRISNQTDNAIQKLRKSQLSSGAWSWFKGMREDRYSTQQIVLGFARLNANQIIDFKQNQAVSGMIRKAVKYLDREIKDDYEKLLEKYPGKLDKNHLGSLQIQYLYTRKLLMDQFDLKEDYSEAYEYYLGQAKKYWLKQNNYMQAMIALSLNRTGYRNEAEGILRSLQERSIQDDEMGMYWKQKSGWYWYQAPIETQAMIIEAFNEILHNPAMVDQMKIWLLKQKQTTRWKTSTATAEAVFALLMNGKTLLDNDKLVSVKVGKEEINTQSDDVNVEAGTGYFKTSWRGDEIKADMGNIEVRNPNKSVAWGAAYWQYFEQLDRITSSTSPLSIEKKLFIEELTDEGPVLVQLEEGQSLNTGDKVVSRIIISSDRDMEYVQVNDMRATAFEPIKSISGYQYSGGLGYYENITDVSTDFYIRYLRKGIYVLEYPVVTTQKGTFSNGIAIIQSYYAPEFAAHSEGIRISVE